MAGIVHEVKNVPAEKRKKKVAAYARVSMETEQLTHSFSQQISYYNELIQGNPEWEFAGIYADYGISGTSMAKRPDFQRMMQDCEAGKIDLILVKSISRFARNKIELLETTRHLKSIGVEVRFEKENLSSTSSDGELFLTLLASFAEDEVRSISENIQWAVQKKFENGEEYTMNRALGYRIEDGERMVVPEEAEIVRWLFETYSTGKYSVGELTRMAEEKGFRGLSGKPLAPSYIHVVLHNELYVGDKLLQKTYRVKPGVSKRNHGEKKMYYVEDNHEAIVDRDLFNKVQEILKSRGAGVAFDPMTFTCFTEKVVCGYCGAPVNRRNWVTGRVSKTGKKRWNCTTREEQGNDTCSLKPIMEEDLMEMAKVALGKDSFGDAEFRRKVEKVTLYDRHADFQMADGRKLTVKRPNPSYALKGKFTCGCCGASYLRFPNGTTNKDGILGYYFKCSDQASWRKTTACPNNNVSYDEVMRVAAEALGLKEIDEDIIDDEIRHAEIKWNEITFDLASGERKTVRCETHYALKGKCVCGVCGGTYTILNYTTKSEGVKHTLKCANRIRRRLQEKYGCNNPNLPYGELLRAAADALDLKEIDEDQIDRDIKQVTVQPDRLIFTLRNGKEKIWQRK